MIPTHILDDGTVIEATDKRLRVKFFYEPFLQEADTKREGRPIYKDKEMIEIRVPGSKDVMHFEASDHFKKRFSAHYEAFKNSNSEKIQGTPLDQFPFISASERKEFEYHNIYTAEQLINIADGYVDRIGLHTRDIIKKVQAYMKSAKDNSGIAALVDENEKLKREIDLVKEQFQQFLTSQERSQDDGKVHRRRRQKESEHEEEVRAA